MAIPFELVVTFGDDAEARPSWGINSSHCARSSGDTSPPWSAGIRKSFLDPAELKREWSDEPTDGSLPGLVLCDRLHEELDLSADHASCRFTCPPIGARSGQPDRRRTERDTGFLRPQGYFEEPSADDGQVERPGLRRPPARDPETFHIGEDKVEIEGVEALSRPFSERIHGEAPGVEPQSHRVFALVDVQVEEVARTGRRRGIAVQPVAGRDVYRRASSLLAKMCGPLSAPSASVLNALT